MKATRDGFGDQLTISAKKHDNIIGLSADLGKATKIDKFGKEYPCRIYEVGIAENNMVGIASGMSEYGYKVFLASFASFLTGKYDTIRCSIAYPNVPCVIVGTHCGMAIGRDGVTQMGLEDISLMRSLPNMKIINPATYKEATEVVKYLCNTELDSPHYLRLGRQPVEEVLDSEYKFEFGKGQLIKDGEDITLISTGCTLGDVMKAAKLIESEWYSVRVINMPTIKPIDKDLIVESAEKTKMIFTVEDHSVIGGLGSAVAEVLSEHKPVKLFRIGLEDQFPESGAPQDLYTKYKLSAEEIHETVIDKWTKQSYEEHGFGDLVE